MIPFQTSLEQLNNLASIAWEMKASGVESTFIVEAFEVARVDQGVYDLMEMWVVANGNATERGEILADLQDSVDDYSVK